jgi:hypothetical protein
MDCTSADLTPPFSGSIDCYRCLAYYHVRCLSMHECQDQWGAFNCCSTEHDCTDDVCAGESCPTETAAFNACSQDSGDTCPALWAEGDFLDCYSSTNIGDDAGTSDDAAVDGGTDAGDDGGDDAGTGADAGDAGGDAAADGG